MLVSFSWETPARAVGTRGSRGQVHTLPCTSKTPCDLHSALRAASLVQTLPGAPSQTEGPGLPEPLARGSGVHRDFLLPSRPRPHPPASPLLGQGPRPAHGHLPWPQPGLGGGQGPLTNRPAALAKMAHVLAMGINSFKNIYTFSFSSVVSCKTLLGL